MPETETFGSAFDKSRDGARIRYQHERIRDWMLAQSAWRSLSEMRAALGYPESSISAQLRHLRKARFGRYRVEKRRRHGVRGTWEYKVLPPEKLEARSLFDEQMAS
jgi:hypothetical protein